MTFLDQVFFDNSVKTWIIAFVIGGAIYVFLKIFKSIVAKRLHALTKRTRTEIDDLVVDLLNRVSSFFLISIAIFGGSQALVLPTKVTGIIRTLVIIGFLFQAAIWGNGLIVYWIERFRKEKMEEDPATATTITALGFVGKLLLWVIILLLALDNLGIDVTGLIAGLGIGGIAIALAVQNILGDLFASLSIVLDKPFVIGDFIIVDSYLGVVKHIGLKTTRVQSLSGEQLIFSNSDLLNSRIRNFKRMYERRVVFSLGVIYQTPHEKLERIPGMIRKIIEEQEQARFDRAHFKEYGASSLVYEIVYYVLTPDYNMYMDIQQSINLTIFKRFEEEGIEFAYPTQTLFLQKESNNETELTESN
ncbi:mechanosensitive ion channel [candidate division KSB1 bacterium]|nr:mechanosensitive ion channel [candidate division KSB1 bacterium]NIR70167.1 mechanosensitive ion channel [candidate division KSB1 bacterium]NIS27553.1 mechanosensitive ion channel [candidate division KSB1 bacterium]NIT74406.1 mechanosensitive ion channel [candidate division KSB1 bacterium]NIU28271.1 mechanosensitive ion channel [candidate division KSB1 bacterium]